MFDGCLRVEAGGELVELAAREAVVVPAGVGHQLWNAGDTPVTFLAAAAPPAPGDAEPA